MGSHDVDFGLRWSREDRAKRHGRTIEQARELWKQAARSACCCAGCFRPLSPTCSVTMERRAISGSIRRDNQVWVRVPVCLLCTLDGIKLYRVRGGTDWYSEPRWRRARCLNCARLIRIRGYSLNAQTCCTDCKRAMKNTRNKLRRRVSHEPMACVECGRSFVPKRADAKTCSNRCRQAHHRRQARG